MADNWKQQLHLEVPFGFMNDPNGLCKCGGDYHIFFQYCPDSPTGNGTRGWGHFKTEDLLHFCFDGMVIFPDTPLDRSGAYSGSAVVKDGIINLFYTGNVKLKGDYDYITAGRKATVIRTQTVNGFDMDNKEILLLNDDYPEFCSCHVRDPKVWEDKDGYHMLLGARSLENEGMALKYFSRDMSEWEYAGNVTASEPFGYMWECPDYFKLGGRTFFAFCPQGLKHSDERYQNVYQSGWVETDGEPETVDVGDFHEWDMGFDFYAPQTLFDGERLFLFGWLGLPDTSYGNPTVELGRQHCLTLPRELSFKNGLIRQKPFSEIVRLRKVRKLINPNEKINASLPFDATLFTHGGFRAIIDNSVVLAYDSHSRKAFVEFENGKAGAGRTKRNAFDVNPGEVRIIADRSSLEIFLSDYGTVFSTRFYPENDRVDFETENAEGELWELNSTEVKKCE